MLASSIPVKIGTIFAEGAGGSYITNPLPVPSQIGISNGRASFTDGFPPWCFQAGGYPWGEDFNGLLYMITAWDQWQNAGGPIYYDAAFSSEIGGYPNYALIASASVPGAWWQSQVDNNTSDPDTGGANWVLCTMEQPYLDARYLRAQPATTYYVNSSTGNDSTGTGSSGAPWLTIAHALTQVNGFVQAPGQSITIQLQNSGGTFAAPPVFSGPPGGTLTIQGNVSAQGSYTISGNPAVTATALIMNNSGNVILQGVTVQLTGTNGWCVACTGGSLTVSNVTMNASTFGGNYGCLISGYNGTINLGSGNIYEGTTQSVIYQFGGTIEMGENQTANNTTSSAGFLQGLYGSKFLVSPTSPTWTSTGTNTGARYALQGCAVVYTQGAGANFFPGNSAGSKDSTSFYG